MLEQHFSQRPPSRPDFDYNVVRPGAYCVGNVFKRCLVVEKMLPESLEYGRKRP